MAFPVASVTALGTTRLPGGRVKVRASFLCDNAYPVAGYDLSVAAVLAALGLKMYEVNDAKTGFTDPVVTGVSQTGVLAEVKALKLLLTFPSGGATAAAAANTVPTVTTTPDAGATGLTGSAAKPALAGVLVGGRGVVCPAAMDASTVTVFADCYGYPA